MSPNAPICMGGRVYLASRCCLSCPSWLSCPSCPSCLAVPIGRRSHRSGNEEIGFVPHEIVFAVHRELVILAHENGADRTRLFAVAAEDAPRFVDLIDRRIARTGIDGSVVFGGFEINRISRARDGTETAR